MLSSINLPPAINPPAPILAANVLAPDATANVEAVAQPAKARPAATPHVKPMAPPIAIPVQTFFPVAAAIMPPATAPIAPVIA